MLEVNRGEAIDEAGRQAAQRLPGLDGIRAIAAAMVLIPHTEHILANLGLPHHLTDHPWLSGLARLGVVLFFVLSGFIITYRLCMEEKSQGMITIRRFYIRRILRIWPLYFLIVILALGPLAEISIFQIPGYNAETLRTHIGLKLMLYAGMLPSLVPLLAGLIPTAAHLWSIGTEEQFYLVWPWFMRWFHRWRFTMMLAVIALHVLIETALHGDAGAGIPHRGILMSFWYHFSIDHLALGGLMALVRLNSARLFRITANKVTLLCAVILAALISTGHIHPPTHAERTVAVLFGLIIIGVSAGQLHILELAPFRYLGRISYGIYMYHVLIAVAVVNWLHPYTSSPIVLLSAVVVSVIAVAALSYHTFEAYFLRIKQRYT